MFGFATEGVPLLREGDLTISSTYVRTCVAGGDVSAAAAAMGRPHRVEGVIVRGDGRGRAIGFPTANIETVPHAAIPADGVYAGWLVRGREPQHLPGPEPVRTPAAISVGTNPTFEGRERRVEAYLLDFDGDLYGDHVAVEFIARLRDMERFDRVEDLLARMDGDVASTRELLIAGPGGPAASGPPADTRAPLSGRDRRPHAGPRQFTRLSEQQRADRRRIHLRGRRLVTVLSGRERVVAVSKVLVVDDDPAVRQLVCDVLDAYGYETAAAEDGFTALRLLESVRPDCVVLDIMMPGLDGHSVLRRIRESDGGADLPVVMLTAAADDQQAWQAWSEGVDYFLAKPFEPDELLRFLRYLNAA